MVRYILSYILPLLFAFVPKEGIGQIFAFKAYNHKNGLTINSVSEITEKSDGGILIGTDGAGIIEFDGYHFQDYIDATLQINDHITSIVFWKNKTIYSTRYRGISIVDTPQYIRRLIGSQYIGQIKNLKVVQNTLIIAAYSDFYTYNLETNELVRISQFKKNNKYTLHSVIQTDEGIIYLTDIGNFICTNKLEFKKLNDYFKTTSTLLDDKKFGFEKKGMLYLFDEHFKKGIIIQLKRTSFNYKEKVIQNPYNLSSETIVSSTYNVERQKYAFVSSKGQLYEIDNFTVTKIPSNHNIQLSNINKIFADSKGNYWICTHNKGLVKVCKHPFTKLNYQPHFRTNEISHIYKSDQNKLLVSNFESTFISDIFEGPVKKLPFRIFSHTKVNDKTFFGTNTGIYEFNDKTDEYKKLTIPDFPNECRIQFITHRSPYFWVNAFEKGLYQLDENFRIVNFYADSAHVPLTIYTGQFSDDNKYLYLGSSSGIRKIDLQTQEVKKVKTLHLGHYCGLSAKDAFGTIWFTVEKGLIGISKKGEILTLSDSKLFPSYLFYSLNSDDYGNLILGTNKGLNVIQINENGQVLSQRSYFSGVGFEGYETNMRASFQEENIAYVGTLEGMFYLDFEYLQLLPPPSKPHITFITENVDKAKNHQFSFLTKNPITKTVFYSYRIKDHQDKWTSPSLSNQINLSNLRSGNYQIEVKATYDGTVFSDVATYDFTIRSPYLRNTGFIVSLIVIVLVLNLLFYFISKRSIATQLQYTEDFFLSQRYAPYLLLFGAVCNCLINIITPYLMSNFFVNYVLLIVTTALLLTIFYFAIQQRNKSNNTGVKFFMRIGYITLLTYNLYCLYDSSLHPFYGFAILLVTSAAPFLFEKTTSTAIYAICFVSITIFIILSAHDVYYDKYLLVLPITISGILSILINFIRHDMLHQLAFISSIVNKGSFIALATTRKGEIKFASDSISHYLNLTGKEMIGESIEILGEYLTDNYKINGFELQNKFLCEHNFVLPMINRSQEITWIQWSCRDFQRDTRVVIGQDVTEKINLQNTYEILVENAEDLIYQIDLDGNIQFLNNRFNDYLKIDRKKLIGKPISSIYPEQYKDYLISNFKKQLEEQEKVSYFEFPLEDKNGYLQWFGQLVTLLVEPATNKPKGYLAVSRNITERVKKDNIIENQRVNIQAGFNYAHRIQMSLLPSSEKLSSYFKEQFVFFKPKDIVSGDFYWCNQIDNYLLVAVGDSTGHGVPGAFMSILGINLLNSIVLEKQLIEPGRILNELDVQLKQMMHSGNDPRYQLNDGIEITVCAFNLATNEFEYACAGSKIILHDGHTISIRKGDSKHIGDTIDNFQGYVTHYLTINNQTTIYLLTDGFQDQFGGIHNKKYSLRRLMELINQNVSLPLAIQGEFLEEEFESWKNKNEQTDDATIVALRKL
ncbi:MAG TPA: SpoIIE family protein phosphatase [Taishania sp.]|nr:SpoIIE family protein phosphatase [Taishania sp.]